MAIIFIQGKIIKETYQYEYQPNKLVYEIKFECILQQMLKTQQQSIVPQQYSMLHLTRQDQLVHDVRYDMKLKLKRNMEKKDGYIKKHR